MTTREIEALALLRRMDCWLPAWFVARELGVGIRAASAALRGLRAKGLATRGQGRWCGRRVGVWRFG